MTKLLYRVANLYSKNLNGRKAKLAKTVNSLNELEKYAEIQEERKFERMSDRQRLAHLKSKVSSSERTSNFEKVANAFMNRKLNKSAQYEELYDPDYADYHDDERGSLFDPQYKEEENYNELDSKRNDLSLEELINYHDYQDDMKNIKDDDEEEPFEDEDEDEDDEEDFGFGDDDDVDNDDEDYEKQEADLLKQEKKDWRNEQAGKKAQLFSALKSLAEEFDLTNEDDEEDNTDLFLDDKETLFDNPEDLDDNDDDDDDDDEPAFDMDEVRDPDAEQLGFDPTGPLDFDFNPDDTFE